MTLLAPTNESYKFCHHLLLDTAYVLPTRRLWNQWWTIYICSKEITFYLIKLCLDCWTVIKHTKKDLFSLTSYLLPFIANFNLGLMQCHQLRDSQTKLSAWHKTTAKDLVYYQKTVKQNLNTLTNNELDGESDITDYIRKVSEILHKYANECIPSSSFHPFTRPGWT